MAEVNYPGNTHKAKTEKPEKKIEQVTKSVAVQRKKPLGRKIAETMTGDDAQSVGNYILFDVIIPAAKAMISDATSQGVERMLFGEVRRGRPSSSSRGPAYTSYNRMSSGHPGGRAFEPDGPRRDISRRARVNHEFSEIILATRGEAEEVLDRLGDLVDTYDFATVSDLYELVGITGSFTDDKWGWADLRGAEIRRVREGYLLNLPKTQPAD